MKLWVCRYTEQLSFKLTLSMVQLFVEIENEMLYFWQKFQYYGTAREQVYNKLCALA